MGYIGLIDRVLEEILAELGTNREEARIVSTGGYAALIAKESRYIEETDTNLTLEGLYYIYERNKNSRSRFLLSLAPMAGYTDTAFRVLCQCYGADETVTEMVSARALYHGDQKSLRLMQTDPAETGVTVQIFGSEPEILADVVKTVLNDRTDFSCIDIMRLPGPKIVKMGKAALLRSDAAARLAEAVVRVSRNR